MWKISSVDYKKIYKSIYRSITSAKIYLLLKITFPFFPFYPFLIIFSHCITQLSISIPKIIHLKRGDACLIWFWGFSPWCLTPLLWASGNTEYNDRAYNRRLFTHSPEREWGWSQGSQLSGRARALKTCSKTLTQESIGSGEEPTTVVLPNVHVVKLSSKCLCFYPCIS